MRKERMRSRREEEEEYGFRCSMSMFSLKHIQICYLALKRAL